MKIIGNAPQRKICQSCKYYIKRIHRYKRVEWCLWENKKLQWIKLRSSCFKFMLGKAPKIKVTKNRSYRAQEAATALGVEKTTLIRWSDKLRLRRRRRYRYPSGYGNESKRRVWSGSDIFRLREYQKKHAR